MKWTWSETLDTETSHFGQMCYQRATNTPSHNLVPRGLQRQTPGREYRQASLVPLNMTHFVSGACVIVSFEIPHWSKKWMKWMHWLAHSGNVHKDLAVECLLPISCMLIAPDNSTGETLISFRKTTYVIEGNWTHRPATTGQKELQREAVLYVLRELTALIPIVIFITGPRSSYNVKSNRTFLC